MVYQYHKTVFIEEFHDIVKLVVPRYQNGVLSVVLNKDFYTYIIKEIKIQY